MIIRNFLLKSFTTLVVVCFLGLAYSCSDDDVVEEAVVPDDNGEQVDPTENEDPDVPDDPDDDDSNNPDDTGNDDEDEQEQQEQQEQQDPAGDDGIVKILCIGNSFSTDAVEQNLWELFDAANMEAVIGNLYVGSCTLEMHYDYATNNTDAYSYRKIVNGNKTTTANTTMRMGIEDEDWDYISLQQSSPISGMYETYTPYLPFLVDYVRSNAMNEKMKVVFHQTWAFASDYNSSNFANYDYDQLKMYYAINDAVQRAVADNDIDIVVPVGTAIQNGRASYLGDTFNRDGRHLEETYGRFTAACTWFETISGIDVTTNSYCPSSVDADTKDVVTHAAHFAVQNPYEINDMTEWKGEEDDTETKTGVIYATQLYSTATSATASWNIDGWVDDLGKDYSYTFALYNDAACTDLRVSWVSPLTDELGDPMWKPGDTARVWFTFGGLEPSTSYWLTVRLTDDASVCTEEPLQLTTSAEFATKVTATENAAAGDVILAQSFDKLIHGGNLVNRAAGVIPTEDNRSTLVAPTGENPSGFVFVNFNTEHFSPFPLSATGVGKDYTEAVGLSGWCTGNDNTGTSLQTRPGYIKFGSKAANKRLGYLGTPELSAIPEGKTATIKVEFKAKAFKWGSTWYCSQISVALVDNVEVDSSTMQVSSWGTSTDSGTYVDNRTVSLTQDDDNFTDYSLQFSGVTNTSRIRFASSVANRGQFSLDDVVITIVSLE